MYLNGEVVCLKKSQGKNRAGEGESRGGALTEADLAPLIPQTEILGGRAQAGQRGAQQTGTLPSDPYLFPNRPQQYCCTPVTREKPDSESLHPSPKVTQLWNASSPLPEVIQVLVKVMSFRRKLTKVQV